MVSFIPFQYTINSIFQQTAIFLFDAVTDLCHNRISCLFFSISEKEKAYDREDLYDTDLVLSATNNEKVNNDVYSACKCLGISVNTASNRMKCDFYFPSILQKEETVIGLNSAGNPAKTKNVRKEMQKWIEEAGEKHE